MNIKDGLAGFGYLMGAHAFDALYALTCKKFSYFAAIGVMFLVLTTVSVVLVGFASRIRNRIGWDVLGLCRLNLLVSRDGIPQREYWARFKRWCMRRRLTIFLAGSCFIGPPVVTILLRKPDNRFDTAFYILSGTLISVVVWVTLWKGFWNVWALYIRPAIFWLT